MKFKWLRAEKAHRTVPQTNIIHIQYMSLGDSVLVVSTPISGRKEGCRRDREVAEKVLKMGFTSCTQLINISNHSSSERSGHKPSRSDLLFSRARGAYLWA